MSRLAATPATADSDISTVRAFVRTLKIACDELHDEPFSAEAREALQRIIADDAPAADEAYARLGARGQGCLCPPQGSGSAQ